MKLLNSKDYLFITFVGLVLSFGLVLFGISEMQPYVPYFLVVIAVILSLMNPKLLFWLFLALIPLDIVIVSPTWFPLSLRPYQLFGVFAIAITIYYWSAKSLDNKLLSFKKICLICKLTGKGKCETKKNQKAFGYFDRIVFMFPIFAFFAIVNSPQKELSLKLSIILVSFVLLFWLVRNFTQKKQSLFEALWFFAVGTVPVLLFGFYQAIANRLSIPSFEVFEERVNSTFTEPDWFGMYLVILVSLILWFRLMLHERKDETMIGLWSIVKTLKWASAGDLFLIISLILLTVARSAWLGLLVVVCVYVVLLYFQKEKSVEKKINKIVKEVAALVIVFALAVSFVWGTGLSKFHFFNRAASSVSGMQKITISCSEGAVVPDQIQDIRELRSLGCIHINIEQIELEKIAGKEIHEILRPDPNIDIRKEIYAKTWTEIQKHPLLGQGMGTSGVVLGKDKHGSAFNASNIFLESWLSMGFGGLIILILFFSYPIYWSLRNFKERKSELKSSFVLLTTFAVLIPNLFNSGLLLGVFWMWLAAISSVMNESE